MKPKAVHYVSKLLAAIIFGTAILLSPSVQSAEQPPARKAPGEASAMETQWRKLQQTLHPEIVISLSEAFQRDYPHSRYRQANLKIQDGARKALRAQHEARLSSDALDDPAGDRAYRGDLTQALRGDKNAAYRIALMYRKGTHGLAKNPQRSTQWLRIAAELGNGRASWEVANIYNRDGETADAAKFEAKAVRDGFRIPPRMPNRGLTN